MPRWGKDQLLYSTRYCYSNSPQVPGAGTEVDTEADLAFSYGVLRIYESPSPLPCLGLLSPCDLRLKSGFEFELYHTALECLSAKRSQSWAVRYQL